MIVTHLFQVLGFMAMEPPATLDAKQLLDERAKVFDAVKPLDVQHVVRGQYDGYRAEPGVPPDSSTETMALVLPDSLTDQPACRVVAAEIGASYLGAANRPRDPLVVAAYTRLRAETDRMFDVLVRREDPHAVRIVFTRNRAPYTDADELVEAARVDRVLEITTAAVHPEPLHPLLRCELGGPFDRFRAVHDLVGHAQTGLGFSLDDELAAWRIQDRLHGQLARRALATELLAINSARAIIGEPPPHKATLLRSPLVRRARAQVDLRESTPRSL
jgi:hypothetical protein